MPTAFTPYSFVMIRIFHRQYESCLYCCVNPIPFFYFINST